MVKRAGDKFTNEKLQAALARYPRMAMAHLPTKIEWMGNLGAELGIDLWVKRDDCTGIGFGGNKVRQLEYYFGAAQVAAADTVLITGAIQSNFTRTAAAMARRLGLDIHIQMEERVPGVSQLYRDNGNVLLDKLLGATLHNYPHGENEVGADAAVGEIAEGLRAEGRRPFIIPLGVDHPPLGALGYIVAAQELLTQLNDADPFDEIIIASGSALTHIGLLYGLRALGSRVPVLGVCVRRDAASQRRRIRQRLEDLAEMMDLPVLIDPQDIRLYDGTLAPGYGRMSEVVSNTIRWTAHSEGLFLDPVYTGKAMAGLIELAEMGELAGHRILFWHTGGQPALFGYGDAF